MTYRSILAELEKTLSDLSFQEAPTLLGELERLKAMIWTRLMRPSPNDQGRPANKSEPDQLLTPEEAGQLLGVTPRWLYRHAKRLPFTRRLSRKTLRFSEAGLRRWQAAQKA